MARLQDDRSPLAVAMEWTSRVTSIAMEMVIPALVGFWLDERWGTYHVLTVVGAVVGFVVGLMSLLQLARVRTGGNSPEDDKKLR